MRSLDISRQVRLITLIISFFLCLTLYTITSNSYSYAGTMYSGTSGTCNWVIDSNGLLTITPSNGVEGVLSDWGEYQPEWFVSAYTQGSITGVKIEGKVIALTTKNMFRNTHIMDADITGLDTSQVKDMSSMFYNCRLLENIDISGLDTSNATTMAYMFDGCNNVQALDVSRFNTSKVTNMEYMFAGCSKIKALDVSGFDTSKVTNMCNMFGNGSSQVEFDGCYALASLDTSHFNTSNVKDMSHMFEGCESLQNIETNAFDTSRVSNMKGIFHTCSCLRSVDVSGFDTSNVTDMSEMFANCKNLTQINIRTFDTSKVESMRSMFSQCDKLLTIDLSGIDTSKVEYMTDMFSYCPKLTSVDVSEFNTSSVVNMGSMFCGCSSLQAVDVSHFDTSNVLDMRYMFCDCSSLSSIDVSHFNTSMASAFQSMFKGCSNVSSLDVSGFDISNAYNMEEMFHGCIKLSSLDLSGFNTSNVTDMSEMFSGCSTIKKLDLSSFQVTNVTDLDGMFKDCATLKNLDISSFKTEKECTINNMFSGCRALKSVDMSGLKNLYLRNQPDEFVFEDCKSLIRIETPPNNSYDTCNLHQPMYGSDGKIYTSLPWDIDHSITLTLYPSYDLNYKGKVTAYVSVIDEQGNSIDSGTLKYSYLDENNQQKTGETTIDRHGYASFQTGEMQYDESKANKSGIDVRKITFKPTAGSSVTFQDVPVEININPLSYEQKVSLSVKGSASIEEGASVGASAAVVEEKAKLINGAITGGVGTGLEATVKHVGDKTSLKLKHTMSGKLAGSVETGADISVFQNDDEDPNVGLLNVEGKITGTNTKAVAMEIKDINKITSDESIELGKFLLASLLIDGSQGAEIAQNTVLWGRGMHNVIILKYIREAGFTLAPMREEGYELAISGKANAANLKIPLLDESISVGSFSGKHALSTKKQTDNRTEKTTMSASYNTDQNMSCLKEKYVDAGILDTKNTTGITISSEKDEAGEPSLSMSVDTGGKSYLNISDQSNNITYKINARQREKVLEKINQTKLKDNFNRLIYSTKNTIWNPDNFIMYCGVLKELDDLVSIENKKKRSTTFGFNLPVGLQAIVGAKIKLEFSGVETRTIDTSGGYIWPNEPMTPVLTTEDNIEAAVNQNEQDICNFLYSQIGKAFDDLQNIFDSVVGSVDKAVQYGSAIVKAGNDGITTAKNWVVKITGYKNPSGASSKAGAKHSAKAASLEEPASFGLVTIKSAKAVEDMPADAVTSISIGEPYIITMEDQNGQQIEDWEGQTLDLTLSYTQEDLEAAQLTGDSLNGIGVCRYDEDADAYVFVGGTHDAEDQSVTATISEEGQYILFIDRVAPSISGIRMAYMDGRYVVLADISEMNRISSFSLKLDGQEIVNADNFYSYYHQASHGFCYPLQDNLTEGTHTLSFDATDSAGNRMKEPVTYVFSNSKPLFEMYQTSINYGSNIYPGSIAISGSIEESSDVELVVYYEMEVDGETVTAYAIPSMYGTYFECYPEIPLDATVKSIWIESTDKNGFRSTTIIPEEDWEVQGDNPGGDDEQNPTPIDHAIVSGIADKTYSGRYIVLNESVKLGDTVLENGADYTVTYKNNKNVGKATVIITGTGNYTGSIKKTFKINPKGTYISRLTPRAKAVTVKWKKQASKMSTTKITGYQIMLATNSKFTAGKKTITVKGYTKISKKVAKLKAKKKYYVKIRTYKTVSGVKYYSSWSKTKTVKVK